MSKKNIYFNSYFPYKKKNKAKISHKKKVNYHIKNTIEKIRSKNNFFEIFDKKFKLNVKLNDLNKYKKFKRIVIIGIGGSILGTEASNNFLKGKIKKDVFFLDNLDPYIIKDICNLKNLRKSLFIIISKSGNTLEVSTIISALKLKAKFNKNNTLVITENKNSRIFSFAKKNKIRIIHHRKYVGGRYSIFSETALIPCYLMGINIIKIRKKISYYLFKSKNTLIENLFNMERIYKLKKIKSLILLSYCPGIEYFLLWCQQLIAESLGKKGKGILPVISIAPRDNHSLLQLFLDGPKDKFYYIFSTSKKNSFIYRILHKQKTAMISILKNKKLPYLSLDIKDKDEETLGELFSYFIFETIFISKSLGVNPFDQPAVEQLKILTKKYLLKTAKYNL